MNNYGRVWQHIHRIAIWLIGLTMLIPLLIHMYLGTHSRFIADDYCTTGSLRALGFLESQAYWYSTWSGRYAFTFTINALESLGTGIAQVIPAVVMILWLVALALLLKTSSRVAGFQLSCGHSLVLAALLEVVILAGAGNPFQSIYWFTGVVTYSVPLVLLCAYLALFLHLSSDARLTIDTPGWLLLSFVLTFFAGGFSETYVTVQLAITVCMVLGILVLAKPETRIHLLKYASMGLIGTIFSMAAIIFAPGNSVRIGLMPERAGIILLLERTILDIKIFLSRVFFDEFAAILMATVLPAIIIIALPLSSGHGRSIKKAHSIIILLGLPAMAILLLFASILPYEYGISSYPDDRVLMIARFVLYTVIGVWSIVVGAWMNGYLREGGLDLGYLWVPILVAAVSIGSVISYKEISSTLEDAPRMVQFAASWDSRHEDLKRMKESGERRVAAASLTHMGGLAEIARDPDEWINRCIAQTYNLDQIIAK